MSDRSAAANAAGLTALDVNELCRHLNELKVALTERIPRPASSIAEFCKQHSISQAFYHELQRIGSGPRVMRVEGRVLISAEAAAAWRRAHERDTTRKHLRKERRAGAAA
jgi:hypothetical protein